jgi:hypothetical protein
MVLTIYFGCFFVCAFILFRVKYLVKKIYPKQHDEIYGRTLIEYSPAHAIKIIRFSLFKKEWLFVTDQTLVFWLHMYRAVSLIFYGIHVLVFLFAVGYILVKL